MKYTKTVLLAAASLVLMTTASISTASATPLPGGNPNCQTNWVGGACGPRVNLGGGPVVRNPVKHSPEPCPHEDTEDTKA